MKSYQIVRDLLDHLERYEQAHKGRSSVPDFARWVLQEQPKGPSVPVLAFEMHRISQLVVYLQRYAKGYTRKALEGTALNSDDELIYVIILFHNGPMSKTALIHENRHEKPTGMDIIRRLISAGFIAQSDNPEDGRSKLLQITESGKNLVQKLEPRLNFVAELLTGNLDQNELGTLFHLLEKLENYHQVIQAKSKGGDFADLIRAVKSS